MADSPVVSFSTDVTVDDFNAAFDGSWQEFVDDNFFVTEGKPDPDKNPVKTKLYYQFRDSTLRIKGTLDGDLVGIVVGDKSGSDYNANMIMYAPINGSKSHMHDSTKMVAYEEGLRDFLSGLGITRIVSPIFKPSSQYTYHYVNKPTRHLVNIISETITETRIDGKQHGTVIFEYL